MEHPLMKQKQASTIKSLNSKPLTADKHLIYELKSTTISITQNIAEFSMFIVSGDGGAGGLQATSSTLHIAANLKCMEEKVERHYQAVILQALLITIGPRTFPCCTTSRVQSLWMKQFVCPQNRPNTPPSRGLVSMWSLQVGECNHTFSTVNCDANPHSLHQHLRKIASAKSGGSRIFSLQLFKKNVEW